MHTCAAVRCANKSVAGAFAAQAQAFERSWRGACPSSEASWSSAGGPERHAGGAQLEVPGKIATAAAAAEGAQRPRPRLLRSVRGADGVGSCRDGRGIEVLVAGTTRPPALCATCQCPQALHRPQAVALR